MVIFLSTQIYIWLNGDFFSYGWCTDLYVCDYMLYYVNPKEI